MSTYTQGEDGAAILKNGERMSADEIVAALNGGEAIEPKPAILRSRSDEGPYVDEDAAELAAEEIDEGGLEDGDTIVIYTGKFVAYPASRYLRAGRMLIDDLNDTLYDNARVEDFEWLGYEHEQGINEALGKALDAYCTEHKCHPRVSECLQMLDDVRFTVVDGKPVLIEESDDEH